MKLLIELAVMALFTVMLIVVLVEFMAGCGETYIDAKGMRHANECFIINPTP